MKVILEFPGDSLEAYKNFQWALDSKDEEFDILDSIYWEMDYGDGESKHHTKFGDITIKTEGIDNN